MVATGVGGFGTNTMHIYFVPRHIQKKMVHRCTTMHSNCASGTPQQARTFATCEPASWRNSSTAAPDRRCSAAQGTCHPVEERAAPLETGSSDMAPFSTDKNFTKCSEPKATRSSQVAV